MPPRWADSQKKSFLQARMADFRAAQAAGSTGQFFQQTMQKLDEQWPFPQPTGAFLAAVGGDGAFAQGVIHDEWYSKIKTWFYNAGRKSGRSKITPKKRVLDLKPPRSYTYPAATAYCLMYYRKKLEPELEQEYKDLLTAALANDTIKVENQITFINRRCRELYEKETPEVQAEVEAYVQELKDAGRIPEHPLGDEDPQEVEAWNLRQQAIAALPHTFQLALEQVHAQTGWVGTVFLGGLSHEDGADKLSSLAVHTTGKRMWDKTDKFEEIHREFDSFLATRINKRQQKAKRSKSTVDGNTTDDESSDSEDSDGDSDEERSSAGDGTDEERSSAGDGTGDDVSDEGVSGAVGSGAEGPEDTDYTGDTSAGEHGTDSDMPGLLSISESEVGDWSEGLTSEESDRNGYRASEPKRGSSVSGPKERTRVSRSSTTAASRSSSSTNTNGWRFKGPRVSGASDDDPAFPTQEETLASAKRAFARNTVARNTVKTMKDRPVSAGKIAASTVSSKEDKSALLAALEEDEEMDVEAKKNAKAKKRAVRPRMVTRRKDVDTPAADVGESICPSVSPAPAPAAIPSDDISSSPPRESSSVETIDSMDVDVEPVVAEPSTSESGPRPDVEIRVASAAEWLKTSIAAFALLDARGSNWMHLLDVFVDHELELEPTLTTSRSFWLQTGKKFEVVKQWKKDGRVFTDIKCDTVKKPAAFATEFFAVWFSLQPLWRSTDSSSLDDVSKRVDGWEKLSHKAGPNGIHDIVLALYLWGRVLPQQGELVEKWKLAINDVVLVLGALPAVRRHQSDITPDVAASTSVSKGKSKQTCDDGPAAASSTRKGRSKRVRDDVPAVAAASSSSSSSKKSRKRA